MFSRKVNFRTARRAGNAPHRVGVHNHHIGLEVVHSVVWAEGQAAQGTSGEQGEVDQGLENQVRHQGVDLKGARNPGVGVGDGGGGTLDLDSHYHHEVQEVEGDLKEVRTLLHT